MRIASVSNPDLVNSNYRAYRPMGVLSRKGHEVWVNREGDVVSLERLLAYEVVHIHRVATPEIQWIAARLRERGVGVVWDNDDDVSAVPKSNPLYGRFGGAKSREMLARVTTMVRLAHVVTTPSAVLAGQYRELGAQDVRILENYVPREFEKVRHAKHRGIGIVALAALEHQVDYQQLRLRETLARLLEAHPELFVASLGLGLGIESDRYENLKLIPFLDIAKVLSRYDVGIAPLTDIPWNRARSNVKLKEYASGGLCWLASPVGPYLGMGEAQGGRLVPDGEWEAALERLIVNARERRKLAKRAVKWVKGEGVERHADRWEQALRDAAARARDEALSRGRAQALR
jgi:hypothetical protein